MQYSSCIWQHSVYWKNNNTCTVQAESSKFASVLFNQGFQNIGWLELIGMPSDDPILPGFAVYYVR